MTGERLNRRSWTELPMGNNVITAVEAMTLSEGQPILESHGSLFEWRPGVPLNDGDANMYHYPPLNKNVDNYELEPQREIETGAYAEDYKYDNVSITVKEEIIDDVDDAKPIEEYEETSVIVDVPDPSVDPTPIPRVPDPEYDSESLASKNAGDRPPINQTKDKNYRNRATEHHMNLRQELLVGDKHRSLYK